MSLRPSDLIFRCYIAPHPDNPGRYIGHCVDLHVWASGTTPQDARRNLTEAIHGYVEAVMKTDDQASIPRLLRRKAPLRYRARWWSLRLLSRALHRTEDRSSSFEFTTPFHLAA